MEISDQFDAVAVFTFRAQLTAVLYSAKCRHSESWTRGKKGKIVPVLN
jgi:hypothetical protein